MVEVVEVVVVVEVGVGVTPGASGASVVVFGLGLGFGVSPAADVAKFPPNPVDGRPPGLRNGVGTTT